MAGKKDKRVEALGKLIASGRYDECALLANSLIFEYGFAPPEKVYQALEICAAHSQVGALAQAMAYITGVRDEPIKGAIIALLDKVIVGSDSEVACQGQFILGRHLCMSGSVKEGLRHLSIAHQAGIAEASYDMGMIYLAGVEGIAVDYDKAAMHFFSAIDQGETEAKIRLAEMIMEEQIEIPDVNPLDLIGEAAEEGNEYAQYLIDRLIDMTEAAANPSILPYKVVPDDAKRPKLVRDALVQELGMVPEQADILTAHLYGYQKWTQLIRAAMDRTVPRGKADEECSPSEFNERQRIQVTIAMNFGIDDEHVAETVINLVKPTSRKGKPSLRRLEDEVNNKLFPMGSGEMEAGMDDFLAHMGFPGTAQDFYRMARTMHPIQPEPWLLMMQQHLGWTFQSENYDAEGDGSKIAQTRAADGRNFDVHMSATSFMPGDKGDELVDETLRKIKKQGPNKVLVFNMPIVSIPKNDKEHTVFYGGKVLNADQWHDFVLRPGGGIDDALAQVGLLDGIPSKEFYQKYGFGGAMSMSAELAAYARGEQPGGPVRFLGSTSGWSSPMVGEAGEALETLSKLRQHL